MAFVSPPQLLCPGPDCPIRHFICLKSLGGGASKSCLRGAVATAGAKMESVRQECSGNWVRSEKHDSLIKLIRLQKGHR